MTSPNGVLLFREASRTIVTYGGQILTVGDIPEEELYSRKYVNYHCSCTDEVSLFFSRLKGIAISFSLLKSSLCGNYVNFGVLKLYGDTAMEDAMNIFVKLLISLPLKNLLVRIINPTFLSLFYNIYILLLSITLVGLS